MMIGERPVPANVSHVQPGMLRLVQQIIPIADHALKERIVRPVLQAVLVKGAHLVMELQRQPDVQRKSVLVKNVVMEHIQWKKIDMKTGNGLEQKHIVSLVRKGSLERMESVLIALWGMLINIKRAAQHETVLVKNVVMGRN